MNAFAIFPSDQFMVITDLDGTLLNSDRTVSNANLAMLHELGLQQIVRVIATGRSLYSAQRVLPVTFPIDYVIFSSGAGVVHWHTQQLLATHHLSAPEIVHASQVLAKHGLDFMVHQPIPDNHYFFYYSTGADNPDFIRRREFYHAYAMPLLTLPPDLEKACQFVAIDPKTGEHSCYERIRQQLSQLSVIRATSPLDHVSTWIEIFPRSVSKALASEWLARQHQIERHRILAIGNDYNDIDLLQWAGSSFLVNNAPDDLKQAYPSVSSNNHDGFKEAVVLWTTTTLEKSYEHTATQ